MKNLKTKRTQIADLPVVEQEITEQEMKKVQGGAKANDGKKVKEAEKLEATNSGTMTTASTHETAMTPIRNLKG